MGFTGQAGPGCRVPSPASVKSSPISPILHIRAQQKIFKELKRQQQENDYTEGNEPVSHLRGLTRPLRAPMTSGNHCSRKDVVRTWLLNAFLERYLGVAIKAKEGG